MTVDANVGFGRSAVYEKTIASGDTTHEPVDLRRPYAFIKVRCEDASNIQASTTLSAKVGESDTDTLVSLRTLNDATGAWASSTLPTSGGFSFTLTNAAFTQRIQFTLSKATSGGTCVLQIWGYDPAVR